MKKLVSLLLALVMCASLTACGGGEEDTPEPKEPSGGTVSEPDTSSDGDPDKQPALDALNAVKVPLDELVAKMNENAESIEDEDLEIMNGISESLDEILDLLPGTRGVTQEELDEYIAWTGQVQRDIDGYYAKYGEVLGS